MTERPPRPASPRGFVPACGLALAAALLTACSGSAAGTTGAASSSVSGTGTPPASGNTAETTSGGRAAVVNVYARAGAGMLTAVTRAAKPLVYVPNLGNNSVSVIDPRTYTVIRTFPVPAQPQHVVP